MVILKYAKEKVISINFDKSHFFKTEASYLGHLISVEGIKADLKRFSDFPENFEKPRTIKQLRTLLTNKLVPS